MESVRRTVCLTAIIAAAAAAGCREAAQAAVTGSTDDFVAAARAATARYHWQDSAVADGFHRVGDDFPAMGEHWVNLARIMADSFAASRPTVLTYIRVNGTARLAGVAYTALLAPGEEPPDFPPARGQWHEHNGSIAEESFLRGHDAHATRADLRLSILHAWVWIQNPDGMFVTDNWALPFARLGLAHSAPSHDAARAAALATEASAYYRDALQEVLSPSPVPSPAPSGGGRARYEDVLDRYARAADSVLRPARTRHRLTTAGADRLASLWPALWTELTAVLPGRAAQLRALENRLAD